MKKIGRNELCPCGSGKKYKKCHMGREEELLVEEDVSIEEVGKQIASLSDVQYGRACEFLEGLDLKALTGSPMGVRFIDLDDYKTIIPFGHGQGSGKENSSGGVFINLYKTWNADPNHVYLAISKDIDDSSLAHLLTHVLDYLGGAKLMPGTLEALALEVGIPVDHLEHTEEYGRWLMYLVDRFGVTLDADDTIIAYLYDKDILLRGQEVHEKNAFVLKTKSDRILRYLSEHSEEVDALIKDLPGYIGPRKQGEQ
jgi:hypothetical protein